MSAQIRPISKNVKVLTDGGFKLVGEWRNIPPSITPVIERIEQLSRLPSVYAYVVDDVVCYVGSAQRGLHRRARTYEITKTLRTASRIREEIQAALTAGRKVQMFAITPEQTKWQGMSINTVAGLEEGLIRELHPMWNRRGRGRQSDAVE
jgi:hypothetical protein